MDRKTSEVARRQAPLRETYTQDPTEAITVKRVRTTETETTDAVHGTVMTPDYPDSVWHYGIDHKVGGLDDLPNPGHVLCAALAGCIDSSVRMIADHLGIGIAHLEVEVVGDVDARGCLAMDPSVRPGFRQIQATIHLEPEPGTDDRMIAALLQQAERLCVTLDTLRNGVPIEVTGKVKAPAA